MKNLILIFSVLFFSSFTIDNSEVNTHLDTPLDEITVQVDTSLDEIVQEDDFAHPCENIAAAVQTAILAIFDEEDAVETIGDVVYTVVLVECCKIVGGC